MYNKITRRMTWYKVVNSGFFIIYLYLPTALQHIVHTLSRHIVLFGSSYNRYAYMYLYKHQRCSRRKKTGVAQTNVRQKILIYIKM